MPLIEKDHGWDELAHRIAMLERGAYVKVGVLGAEASAQHKNSDLTVAELAAVHEFGAEITLKNGKTIKIAERSFIRGAMDAFGVHLQRRASMIGRGVLLGALDERQGLELLGQEAVGMIKTRITQHIPPPNAPSTIARKGSDVPLVDSSQLIGSISHSLEGGV